MCRGRPVSPQRKKIPARGVALLLWPAVEPLRRTIIASYRSICNRKLADKVYSVVALDLHDPQYQGFFDIPMDNLYGRPLLKRYIQQNIPDFKDAVIVSPDAGGAKRATAIADSLGMEFALIHKVRSGLRFGYIAKTHLVL